MIYIHNIDPILFSIGFIDLYWYGAMYAISFLLLDYLMKKEIYLGNSNFDIAIIDKILLISIFSLLIGGRLGYVIFYNLDYYYLNFHKIFTFAFDLRPHLFLAIESADFKYEATLQDHYYFNKKYYDAIIHSKFNKPMF